MRKQCCLRGKWFEGHCDPVSSAHHKHCFLCYSLPPEMTPSREASESNCQPVPLCTRQAGWNIHVWDCGYISSLAVSWKSQVSGKRNSAWHACCTFAVVMDLCKRVFKNFSLIWEAERYRGSSNLLVHFPDTWDAPPLGSAMCMAGTQSLCPSPLSPCLPWGPHQQEAEVHILGVEPRYRDGGTTIPTGIFFLTICLIYSNDNITERGMGERNLLMYCLTLQMATMAGRG